MTTTTNVPPADTTYYSAYSCIPEANKDGGRRTSGRSLVDLRAAVDGKRGRMQHLPDSRRRFVRLQHALHCAIPNLQSSAKGNDGIRPTDGAVR